MYFTSISPEGDNSCGAMNRFAVYRLLLLALTRNFTEKRTFRNILKNDTFLLNKRLKKNFPKTFFLNENKQTFEKKIVFLRKTNDFTERSLIEKTDEIDGKWMIILKIERNTFFNDWKNEQNGSFLNDERTSRTCPSLCTLPCFYYSFVVL